jgi:hypothetical protein
MRSGFGIAVFGHGGRRLGALLLLVLAGCGSSRPSTLYAPVSGNRPSLLDGEIRMTTHWTNSPDEIPDVRAIVCEQGRITCWFEGRGGRREGFVSEAEWNDLWARLEPVAPWSPARFSVKPNDPSGGPYHVIELRAGTQFTHFSSQHRADLLVFTSREAAERLEYSNRIVDFVAAHARTPVEPAAAPAEAPVPSSRP